MSSPGQQQSQALASSNGYCKVRDLLRDAYRHCALLLCVQAAQRTPPAQLLRMRVAVRSSSYSQLQVRHMPHPETVSRGAQCSLQQSAAALLFEVGGVLASLKFSVKLELTKNARMNESGHGPVGGKRCGGSTLVPLGRTSRTGMARGCLSSLQGLAVVFSRVFAGLPCPLRIVMIQSLSSSAFNFVAGG